MVLRKILFQCKLLVACAALVGVIIAGALSDHTFSGRGLHRIAIEGLSSDGWIGPEARFSVSGFMSGLNSLYLSFNPDRPGVAERPRVAVRLCNSAEREVIITSSEPLQFRIPSDCSPLQFAVRGLNAFSPVNERDNRVLSVQLQSMRIALPGGVPLVSFDRMAAVVFVVVSLVVLAMVIAVQSNVSPWIPGIVMLGAVVATGCATDLDFNRIAPCAIFVVSVLFGVALYHSPIKEDRPSAAPAGVVAFAAFVVGTILRLYGITFGLPANFHPDEVPKVNAIMRMVDSGTLNPNYFLHPSLLLYTAYGTNTVLHWLGIEGAFRDTAFLAGRLVSATAGALSIVWTYHIGRRLFSGGVGALAATLLAVFPLHVTCSRYLKEDALLTFVVLSCVLVTIIAVQSGRKWMVLVAGLLAGCTAGTKYSGILMAVVPAMTPWMVSRSWKPDVRWLPWAIVAALVAPVGFLVTTPYALYNFAKFAHDFGAESRHMRTGHTVSITAWSQLWMYHFWRSIWPGTSGLVAVTGVAALGFLTRRARVSDLMIVGLVLLFYLPAEYVKAKPAPQPERYIVPCLPFVAIAIAELFRAICAWGRTYRVLVVAFAAGCLLAPLYRTVTLAQDIRDDTRVQMARWVKETVPPGAKVLMDWKPYCPNLGGEPYNVEHIPRAEIVQSLDVERLRRSGADYLILSSLFYNRYFSQPDAQPFIRQRFREVFERVPVMKQFEASSGTYGFHNPTITLFSLKPDDFARLQAERDQKRRGEIAQTTNDVRAQARW